MRKVLLELALVGYRSVLWQPTVAIIVANAVVIGVLLKIVGQ